MSLLHEGPPQVPLMVGVTGHRDLVDEELPSLEHAVEAFFCDLRRRFPALPLLVTTPLAEGADRLVARVARRLDIPLNVLLPMPLELYERDFDGQAAEVFEEMLRDAEMIELPLLSGLQPGSALLGGAARDAQYEYLGIYLAAHSHVLLALWDGKPSPSPGGTAQVVRFHQQNEVRLLSGVEARSAIDFSEDESDLAYHIACSRSGNGRPAGEHSSGQGVWLTRDDLQPRTSALPVRYQAVFRQQERLNLDLAATAARPPQPHRVTGHAQADASPDVDALTFAVDALAVRFQRRSLWTLRAMYALAALAGISFIVYADFPDQDAMIWVYLSFLSAGIVLYLLERRGRWYRRYVDYRGLAEGLRIQRYWAAAGVRMENPTQFAHDLFMRRDELSLGWIRNVMRYTGRASDAITRKPPEGALEAILDTWIREQHEYYRRRLSELVARSRFTNRMGLACFIVALGAAVLLALLQEGFADVTTSLLIALMVGLPYLAAVRGSYGDRICERELIAQYAHMDRIYANAHRLLSSTEDPATKRNILRALGAEALQEVGQWILRQRERPVSGEQLFRTG